MIEHLSLKLLHRLSLHMTRFFFVCCALHTAKILHSTTQIIDIHITVKLQILHDSLSAVCIDHIQEISELLPLYV
jgi:hypothetical protein